MQKWLGNIFRSLNRDKESRSTPARKIDFEVISTTWNADPVSPEVELKVEGNDLIMDMYLNYYVFDFKKGDKLKVRFKDCSWYSYNACNDEGYFYGQYRTTNQELPWGEFYEINNGLDGNFPEPIVLIKDTNKAERHFVFFFKDQTFECFALGFELDFYNMDQL